jgi:hypothetical protein
VQVHGQVRQEGRHGDPDHHGRRPGQEGPAQGGAAATVELAILPEEGAYHPSLAVLKVVGLLADGSMPRTGTGSGGFVVRVLQTTSVPSVPVAGVAVDVRGATGAPVATARTGPDGTAALKGIFNTAGTYTIVATLQSETGLSLDGSRTVRVRAARSPVVTQSGRTFRFRDGAWRLLVPAGAAVTGRAAQAAGDCRPDPRDIDVNARFTAFAMKAALIEYRKAATQAIREEWAGRFINRYLGARELGLLERRAIQDLLRAVKVSVPNVGTGQLKPVTSLCDNPTVEQARKLGRGYDLGSGPLPVISAPDGLGLPDGTVVSKSAFVFNTNDLVLAPPPLEPGRLRLSLDERVLLVESVIATGGGNLSPDLRNAIAAVIATGGGNVIATGGGNVIATGGATSSRGTARA